MPNSTTLYGGNVYLTQLYLNAPNNIRYAPASYQASEEPMPATNRLRGSDIAVYYDEANNAFAYVLNGNYSRISRDLSVRHVEDFYRQNSSRYNILPRQGSQEYADLLKEATATSEERLMTLAKPPDEYSITITYSEEEDNYIVYTAPAWASGEIFKYVYSNLSHAYDKARYLKSEYVYNDYGKPWKVWPRLNSAAHKLLVEKIDNSLTSTKVTFMQVIDELNEALKHNSAASEEVLQKTIKYMNKTGARIGVSRYRDDNILALNSYIKATTGIEYIIAIYDDKSNSRLVHPDNAKRVYSGLHKNEGSRSYTSYMASRLAKACSSCNDIYLTSRLIAQGDMRYCHDCFASMGMYTCGLCGTWHNEDAGCSVYHSNPHEHIYNYSTDVRKVIHKMYSVPSDKKVNGEYLRYGVELEVLPKTSVASKVAKYNCGKSLHNFALLKSDSSLGSAGFEIVTVPATLEFHRKVLWNDFFKTPFSDGLTAAKSVQSWDTGVCGIHVHLTRAALTEMQLSKLLVFYHEPYNSKFLSRIAGREVGFNAVYCKTAKKKLRSAVSRECGDHHGAITISSRNHGKTAEVRIFRGNSTYHGVMRAIEFVDATAKWCGQNTASSVLDYKNFLDWFNTPTIKKQYPELRKHLIDLKYLKARLKEGDTPHPKMPIEAVKPELKQA